MGSYHSYSSNRFEDVFRDSWKKIPKSVFISGPMRGKPQMNFPAFAAARDLGRKKGFFVYSPADMDRAQGHDFVLEPNREFSKDDLHWALRRDYAALSRCDAIAMLPGWEKSQGASLEYRVARACGMEVLDALTFDPLPEAEMPFSVTEIGLRTFASGATRDSLGEKLEYRRFLSHRAIRCYCQYMHKHRKQANGSLREPDNWKKGIPREVYLDSLYRHAQQLAHEVEKTSRIDEDTLCAIVFNAMGLLHEVLS